MYKRLKEVEGLGTGLKKKAWVGGFNAPKRRRALIGLREACRRVLHPPWTCGHQAAGVLSRCGSSKVEPKGQMSGRAVEF